MGKLTALKIKRKKKPGRYGDGGGLYLAVNENGAKSWIFMWKKPGKRHAMGLGSANTLSLSEARQEATEARKALLDGENPKAERNARKAGTLTFGECADRFVAAMGGAWKSDRHRYQWRQTLSDKYAKTLRPLAVSDIQTEDVLKVVQPIWPTKHITATRLRNRIEQILDWATANGHRKGENPARWRGHMSILLPKIKHSVTHLVAMPHAQVPDFMAALRLQERVPAGALEFLILTATRAGEVLGAKWDEIDMKAKVWTIPKGRMKAGKEHIVPLSGRCMDILQRAEKTSAFVFPGIPSNRPLYHHAMLTVLRELADDKLTVHGFRSSFRDWAGDTTTFPREIVEFALAHGINDKTEEAYRRSTAVEKRRELMELWAGYCEPKAGDVVSIRRKAH
jgi:integrase